MPNTNIYIFYILDLPHAKLPLQYTNMVPHQKKDDWFMNVGPHKGTHLSANMGRGYSRCGESSGHKIHVLIHVHMLAMV